MRVWCAYRIANDATDLLSPFPFPSPPPLTKTKDVRRVGVLMTVRVSEKTDKQIKCEMVKLLPPTTTAPGTKDEEE